MRKTSVREVQRRGKPVAELRSLATASRVNPEERDRIFRSMDKVWSRIPAVGDGTKIIEEDRDRQLPSLEIG